MSKYALGAFLLLYGVTVIFHTEIPVWVGGVLAIVAGLICLGEGVSGKK